MEDQLAEFRCPVCINYMSPPIRQCVQGHLFCCRCFARVKKCAVCRDKKSNVRCVALERVHATLTFPCRYRDEGEGCQYTGKAVELVAHELSCKPMNCPWTSSYCQWQGKCSQISEHAKIEHKRFYLKADRLNLYTKWLHFPQRSYVIISAFDTTFLCILVIAANRRIKILIGHIGDPSLTGQFSSRVAVVIIHGQRAKCYKQSKKPPSFNVGKFAAFACNPGETLTYGCNVHYLVNIFTKDFENNSEQKFNSLTIEAI